MLVCALLSRAHAADIEPILTETDAIAGMPLVMPVRVEGSGQPRAEVTLRFPDGREVRGSVAAVRFSQPASRSGWLPEAPTWEVLTPAQAVRTAGALAWFVLAELPRGVVGQEIWLDGKPVRLRWLPRPAILGMRFGFDPESPGNSLTDPWASPVPEAWRTRADFVRALRPAADDPFRGWRARLATTGLHPSADDGGEAGVAITPEMLDESVVEAAGAEASIAERLRRTVRAQTEARWRAGLARLWAADAALSIRVRQALAGAGAFETATDDRVVAPVWSADPASASNLLAALLDPDRTADERAQTAREWLDALPDVAFWVVDDGVAGPAPGGPGGEQAAVSVVPPTVGAMLLEVGDAGAIPMGGSSAGAIGRPVAMRSRESIVLRPSGASGDGEAVYRISGETRAVRTNGAVVRLTPPGLRTGPMAADRTMAGVVAGSAVIADPLSAPRALVTVEDARAKAGARCRVVVRLPGAAIAEAGGGEGWTVRLWIGPFGRGRAVVIATETGRVESQTLPAGEGAPIGLPEIAVGREGADLLVDLLLPPEAGETDGLVRLGIEVVDPSGDRVAWPRAMMPWQIEPGRRAVDPSAWLGAFGE